MCTDISQESGVPPAAARPYCSMLLMVLLVDSSFRCLVVYLGKTIGREGSNIHEQIERKHMNKNTRWEKRSNLEPRGCRRSRWKDGWVGGTPGTENTGVGARVPSPWRPHLRALRSPSTLLGGWSLRTLMQPFICWETQTVSCSRPALPGGVPRAAALTSILDDLAKAPTGCT